MPLWDLFAQCLLQLGQALRCRFGLEPLEGGFPLLIDDQFAILWSGAIHMGCHLGQSGAEMLDKAFGGHGQIESLTILRHFGCALLPGKELVAVIGKLLRAGNAQVTRLEFCGHVGEDAGFQVLANKPTLAFAPHHDRAEPLLAGKGGEVDRGFQVLAFGPAHGR